MKVLSRTGKDELAYVYLAENSSGKKIEFVESIQPPLSRDEKWVLIVSTLFGCPVGCQICDAGRWYDGKLSKEEILEQIDFLVSTRYPDMKIRSRKFKIQFARMGDPAFNMAVLDAIEEIPKIFDAPGFMPSLSTVAPNGTDKFFARLLEMRKNQTVFKNHQMQFSIHSTDIAIRDKLIPVRKWSFDRIADWSREFYNEGESKISLNFALAENIPVDPAIIRQYFDPDIFLIKLTPVNPTVSARSNNIQNRLEENDGKIISNNVQKLVDSLKTDYDLIISIGELEENEIGSNCGQYVRRYLESDQAIEKSDKMYLYKTQKYK